MSANASSFALSSSAILKNPTVFRYTIQAINTEEFFDLPTGTKAFVAKNTGQRVVKYAYDSGEIASGQFFQLAPWETARSPGIVNQSTVRFYVLSAGLETIEFDIWR